MVFYEVELLSVPDIIFSHDVKLDKYRNSFFNREDYIEIALCKSGGMLFEYSDGTKEVATPGMLVPIFSDISCLTSQYNGERQEHITVGVKAQYRLKKYESETKCNIDELKKRIKNGNTVLVPYHCTVEDIYGRLINLFQKIILFNSSEKHSSGIYALAYWYILAGTLTDYVLKRITCVQSDISPSEFAFAEKAAQFINENYTAKITVNEIADKLGISCGYLHRIFKRVKGTGITEYINQQRISNAVKLIENKNVSLKEAAYSVGIDDVAYMSRLFKKVMGVSYREYLIKIAHKADG